jgi:hypothetical protein
LRDNEWLILYSKEMETNITITLFWPPSSTYESTVGENSEYVNLGDWIIIYIWRFWWRNFWNKKVRINSFPHRINNHLFKQSTFLGLLPSLSSSMETAK